MEPATPRVNEPTSCATKRPGHQASVVGPMTKAPRPMRRPTADFVDVDAPTCVPASMRTKIRNALLIFPAAVRATITK